ncbi:MAG TPA: hypothetical protein VJ377_06735 [Dehalococcoidales bacterium]|nr:hypothetical protein [Dehalococcoidales bacterium]
MRIEKKEPPRVFRVGKDGKIRISDCARIYLEPDEQVTFVTESGKEHDFVAKSWGFYATPSVNARLVEQGFKTALVKNELGRYFIMVVEADRLPDFGAYLKTEKNELVRWLDES